CASLSWSSVRDGNRWRRSGRRSVVHTKSTISSWVSTEYAKEPLVHRSTTRKTATTRTDQRAQALEAALRGGRELIGFSEFKDKFSCFLWLAAASRRIIRTNGTLSAGRSDCGSDPP